MLLRVLDYIAAPFGSQEYLLVNYGVKGRDWEPDANGNPITNKTGQADLAGISTGAVSFLSTLTGRYQVLYSAADPTFAKRIQDYQKILAPISVEDASLGLYSATQASKGVQLIQPFGDGITDIVDRPPPAGDLDGLVKDWRSGGGEADPHRSTKRPTPPRTERSCEVPPPPPPPRPRRRRGEREKTMRAHAIAKLR